MSGKEMDAKNVSDDTIVDLYWARDEQAIRETGKKYGRYLYAISYNILRDHLDSEECINDTYLTTWNKIPPARPNVLQRFLSKITRDISMDRYRKAHSQKRVPSELMVSLDELEECIDGTLADEQDEAVRQISRVLNGFLYGLSERDRFIFVCRYYYADSVQQIAKMLTISDKTVYRELARMRQELREALAKEGIFL